MLGVGRSATDLRFDFTVCFQGLWASAGTLNNYGSADFGKPQEQKPESQKVTWLCQRGFQRHRFVWDCRAGFRLYIIEQPVPDHYEVAKLRVEGFWSCGLKP